MVYQFQFKGITEVLKEDIKQYAFKRFEHLDRFLQTFQEDMVVLTIRIEHYVKHNAYILKATLRLGLEVFHHEDDTHDPKKAIDRSEENLIQQAKKFIGRLKERKRPKKKKMARKR